jgi:hypothetical protein
MALDPAERAALALRIAAAIHLDPEAGPIEDQAEIDAVEAGRASVEAAAARAAVTVKSLDQVEALLWQESRNLDALAASGEPGASGAMLRAAGELIRFCSRAAAQGEGGFAASATAGWSLGSCAIQPIVAGMEDGVRNWLLMAGVDLGRDQPDIRYAVGLTDNNQDFAPFLIDGNTYTVQSPRTVELVIKAQALTARDLWRLAYTVHHELFCHAFQGASRPRPIPDAHPTCHWSEGWMDALTMDVVLDWTSPGARPAWLALGGEDAVAELRRSHDHRYQGLPARMTRPDVIRRRRARNAYRRLGEVLTSHAIATSAQEARDLVRRFSLLANTHEAADTRRMRPICANLRTALLSPHRPEAVVEVASACVAFIVSRDLEVFERAVDLAARP